MVGALQLEGMPRAATNVAQMPRRLESVIRSDSKMALLRACCSWLDWWLVPRRRTSFDTAQQQKSEERVTESGVDRVVRSDRPFRYVSAYDINTTYDSYE